MKKMEENKISDKSLIKHPEILDKSAKKIESFLNAVLLNCFGSVISSYVLWVFVKYRLEIDVENKFYEILRQKSSKSLKKCKTSNKSLILLS